MNRDDFEYVTSRHLVLHKWMDKKLVFLLSNFHNPTSYGIIQRKESYALDRKSRRWWLRIFFNFMNISLFNAFVIFKTRTGSNLTYLEFLLSIITALIEEGTPKKRTLPSKNSSKKKNRSSGRKISLDT